MDIFISAMVLIAGSALMAILAVLVWMKLGSPSTFRQTRVGLNGKPFTLIKFRTMNQSKNLDGSLLPDGERLTLFGKFLRETSLDELPEFFNVLRGDMSIVGPRPLLMQYLPRYSAEQARRHEVKPGITGWAQINGRNAASWEDKFKMDVWYVDNLSFSLDVKIMALTVWKILKKEGINQPGEATAREFMGIADGT